MKIIQSFFVNDTTSIRTNTQIVARQAELSNKFLKKHGYDTTLYTDQSSFKYFEHINYDEIKIIDLKEYDIPDVFGFWSVTKLLSCLLTNQPFMHIDFDFFLIEDIIKPHINEPFVCLHYEQWMKRCFFEQLPKEKLIEYFNIDSEKAQAYNFAVFGGINIDIINSCIIELNNIIKNHNNNIDNLLMDISDGGANWKKAVFLEQYILPSMIANKLNLSQLNVMVPESIDARGEIGIRFKLRNRNVIHIWGLKNHIEELLGMNLFLDMIEKYYF